MLSKRTEQFIEWFGKEVEIDDCDPALYMINYFFDRFEFNLEQKYWLCWLYGTTYHFPTAYIIWNEFPDFHLVDSQRLKEWNDKNYKRLRYQTDTKWNKGHLPEMFESYKKWVGGHTQHGKFQSLMGDNPESNFEILWKESKSWFKFGRYTAWFYLQTVKHCVGVNLEPNGLMFEDYSGSRSHRNGFCYAIDQESLIDQKLEKFQLSFFSSAAECILSMTQSRYPLLEYKIDYFAMETALCSFKKLFRVKDGRYYGYYHDRQAEEIKKAEKDGWIGINWQPLWDCRNESICNEYLEGKINKDKMKLFLKGNTDKHLTIIGGLPVSGKTTIMKQIREQLGQGVKRQYGLLRYETYPDHVVLGIYDDSTFAGTDKLSMAVMEDTLLFLKENTKKVLLEGDRLFTSKFITATQDLGYNVNILICVVDNLNEILHRYKKRGQMQNQKFLKGRHTKIQNIQKAFPHKIINTNEPVPEPIICNIL